MFSSTTDRSVKICYSGDRRRVRGCYVEDQYHPNELELGVEFPSNELGSARGPVTAIQPHTPIARACVQQLLRLR